MANEVIKNDSSVSLDWNDVDGADQYHLQVSVYPDFSVLLIDNETLLVSGQSYTDGAVDNARRYWRWRYSTDTGATWAEWSEVGSYYYSTSLSDDVSLTENQCALINPFDVDDKYIFETFPVVVISPMLIPRLEIRNRRGALLTEYVTIKDRVEVDLTDRRFMPVAQYAALRRFNEEVKIFFFAMSRWNGIDYVPNVWKVQYSDEPRLAPMTSGRADHFTGSLTLVEV